MKNFEIKYLNMQVLPPKHPHLAMSQTLEITAHIVCINHAKINFFARHENWWSALHNQHHCSEQHADSLVKKVF